MARNGFSAETAFRRKILLSNLKWLFGQKWLFMNLLYFSKYWKVWLAFDGWKLSGLFCCCLNIISWITVVGLAMKGDLNSKLDIPRSIKTWMNVVLLLLLGRMGSTTNIKGKIMSKLEYLHIVVSTQKTNRCTFGVKIGWSMAAMTNFGKRDCHSGGHITGILLLPLHSALAQYCKPPHNSMVVLGVIQGVNLA